MPVSTYYEILGLKRNCSSEEITKAWETAQRKYVKHHELYKKAQEAYQTLINPMKREMYNIFGISNVDTNSRLNFYTSLKDKRSVKEYEQVVFKQTNTSDFWINVAVTLEDLYNGKILDISHKVCLPCMSCKNIKFMNCPCYAHSSRPNLACGICKGTGKFNPIRNCKTCKDRKEFQEELRAQIEVKPGMYHGQKLVKEVWCYATSQFIKLGVKIVQKPHQCFERQGDDLYIIKKIGINEALCGCNIVITHLDKRKLLCNTQETVLKPGCEKILYGEGMPTGSDRNGRHGNLYIHFLVIFPLHLPTSVLKDIESCLPERPAFKMPNHPETEEFQLHDFDPNFKIQAVPIKQSYYDEKCDKQQDFVPKDQCSNQ
ncbi:uncharacterized protein LOC143460189 [Clavelina lepadiformis]|uniref:uncharacterized protein LOC143460189 n=1 Tax=Clavelina lepadiformis TaxID=159417 RepID=UPI00404169E3